MAELLTGNVTVPLTSVLLSHGRHGCSRWPAPRFGSFCGGTGRAGLPILIWTSAPGIDPNVTVTELSRTD